MIYNDIYIYNLYNYVLLCMCSAWENVETVRAQSPAVFQPGEQEFDRRAKVYSGVFAAEDQ